KERIIYRCFEILPAFLSWGTLFLVFILSWLVPTVVAIFIVIFDCFWMLKIFYLSFYQSAGYKLMKENLSINWLEKIKKLKNWQNIYHLIVLPMYKEEINVVRSSLQSLLIDSSYPKNKMIVVLAVEERGGEEAKKVAKEIEKEFAKKFFQFLITTHPEDIPGEIAGKGSNVAWAIKKAKELIIDKLSFPSRATAKGEEENLFSLPYENVIVSNFDIDTRPYHQYFAVLTWHYLTAENPLKCSYQPIPIYNNNIWLAPAFSRIIATSGTFWQMMQQARPEQLVSYSSHSMPFKAIIEIGYPQNIVSDDSRIFWKSYLAYNGDYKVVPLYYPVSMDAVMAKNLLKTIINQYKQQRRWAWGCENIPYIFYGFLKNKKIPLKEKIRHTFVILEGFWSWAVAALLIFLLGWLPLILGGGDFQVTLLSYNLPKLTSRIMTIAMIGMIVSAILSIFLLPPRPKNFSKWKNLSMIFQWLLLPFTLIIFGAFPALEAQLRLALGKYLGFWVTEKFSPPPFIELPKEAKIKKRFISSSAKK
ncbi:MAG: glycosyltransferase family 2 protein, partial [Candidatus Nealsonbacteria bacterium]|nr:glycosyltransferase family 2 protein [Candidatus Nealsonbacteria bacterium]